jgi:hypothetical protein
MHMHVHKHMHMAGSSTMIPKEENLKLVGAGPGSEQIPTAVELHWRRAVTNE